jgi:DNA primase
MDWAAYNKERVENIKGQVEMQDVLDYYGVRIRTREREFQFPCPLHGDGQDNSYSARMYPESDSTYCFACHKDRDVVEWVRDAEGLSFGKALSFIERSFGVTDVPTPSFDPTDKKTRREMGALLRKQQTAPTLLDNIDRAETKIARSIREFHGKITWKQATKIFFVLDNLRYDVQHGNVEDDRVVKVLRKVYDRVKKWET